MTGGPGSDPVLELYSAERKARLAHRRVERNRAEAVAAKRARQAWLAAMRRLARQTPTTFEGVGRQLAVLAQNVERGQGRYDEHLVRSIRRGFRALIRQGIR